MPHPHCSGIRNRTRTAVALLAIGWSIPPALAADSTTQPAVNPEQLEMETDALSTLNDLQLNTDQLTALQGLAQDAAGKPSEKSAHFTPAYLTALHGLRAALLSADPDKIDDAEEKLSTVEDAADQDLGVPLEPSDAAKTKAEAALKLLTVPQTASYIGSVADTVPDVAQSLVELVDESHDSDADFAADKDDFMNQLKILVAGFNTRQPHPLINRISKFLDTAKHTPAADFPGQRDALHAQAHDLAKSIDPVLSLRHWVEHDMAELLANPQLAVACHEIRPAPTTRKSDDQ